MKSLAAKGEHCLVLPRSPLYTQLRPGFVQFTHSHLRFVPSHERYLSVPCLSLQLCHQGRHIRHVDESLYLNFRWFRDILSDGLSGGSDAHADR